MKKRKIKDLTKPPKLPLVILFAIIFLFIGVLQTTQYVPAYEQLGELTICFFGIYGFILLFDFIKRIMDKIVDKRIKKLEAVESEEISEDGASDKEKKKLFNKAFSKLSKSKEKESITNEEKKEKILKEQRIATIVLEVIYEIQEEKLKSNNKRYMSIDLGINNLASCSSNVIKSFIINGKPIKSINQFKFYIVNIFQWKTLIYDKELNFIIN